MRYWQWTILALVGVEGRKKVIMVPATGKAVPELVPAEEVPVVAVQEMVPSYAPLEPSNIMVVLDNVPSKEHIIHGEPDKAPGLPFKLPVEDLQLPNWRPVAIVKPPAVSPQYAPKYTFGKEPGPIFDRPGKMHRVADASAHHVPFDAIQ